MRWKGLFMIIIFHVRTCVCQNVLNITNHPLQTFKLQGIPFLLIITKRSGKNSILIVFLYIKKCIRKYPSVELDVITNRISCIDYYLS